MILGRSSRGAIALCTLFLFILSSGAISSVERARAISPGAELRRAIAMSTRAQGFVAVVRQKGSETTYVYNAPDLELERFVTGQSKTDTLRRGSDMWVCDYRGASCAHTDVSDRSELQSVDWLRVLRYGRLKEASCRRGICHFEMDFGFQFPKSANVTVAQDRIVRVDFRATTPDQIITVSYHCYGRALPLASVFPGSFPKSLEHCVGRDERP